MATKKTLKASAKKTVAKATPTKAPKPIKVGDKGSFTRRNGEPASGKVTGVIDAANGRWLEVNVSTDRKAPKIAKIRESEFVKG